MRRVRRDSSQGVGEILARGKVGESLPRGYGEILSRGWGEVLLRRWGEILHRG